jgi:peptide chain release factor 2
LLRQRGATEERVRQLTQPRRVLDDASGLLELAVEENDEPTFAEIDRELSRVENQLDALEFQRMMSGPADRSAALLDINAGAGGVDAQDWAEMLLRMYLRWAELHGYKASVLDRLDGDEAGIKSASISIEGDWTYGHLRAESGVHRLVRISPFDASARRHTAFASVYVYPDINDDIEIDINEGDLRIDTYRASGAGGQHVNKTESAVRITHMPSGIVVQCQNERSQHKNRSTAMKMLRSRLYALEIERREAEAKAENALKKEIGFGSQIRSYVLHPYRMVKDHRTGHDTSNTDAVLDGALDGFIRAFLLGNSAQDDGALDV